MKERITMQRLMQEGWIPVLIGILSASVIVSLAHSTGMAYVTAFLLLTLYFVAIAANRVNAKAVVAVAAKRVLQQVVQKFCEILRIRELDDLRRNVLSLWSMQIALTKHQTGQSLAALIEQFAGFEARAESILSALIAATSIVDSGGAVGLVKNSKIALDRIIQVIKSAV